MKRKHLSGPEKKRIAANGKWACGMCFNMLPSSFEIDHIVPLWKGGNDDSSNMWALCSACHSIKTEDETIERIKNKTKLLTFLECSFCGQKLSPYFSHKCSKS